MLAVKALPMSCIQCRGASGEAFRRAWGCDEPVVNPQFWIRCVHCYDVPGGCERCDFRGKTPLRVCPMTYLPGWTTDLLRMHRDYEAGFLPMQGGTLDQDAWTMQALGVLANVMAVHERDGIGDKDG